MATALITGVARKEVFHAFASQDKVKGHFGDLMKNVTLENGLQRMAVWAKKHGSKKTAMFANIEVEKNLPES